jgi:NAD(P)-dependent dehydrogenase (short-subunit alcohol dehydrogenase family)
MATALILGASRGLGLEFARQYAAAGWRTLATARDDVGLQALRDAGAQAQRLDVTASADWPLLASALAAETLDLVIYNAGVFGPRGGSGSAPSDAEFDAVLHANVRGAMQALARFAPRVAARQGRLVFISSGMGSIGETSSSTGWLYRVSKAALNMAVVAGRLDHPGALCVVMNPGWVKTDMGGAGASLEVADSVRTMRATIDGLTPADNGRFVNYDGDRARWPW